MKNSFARFAPIDLSNLSSYSDRISISQVIVFFGRMGITFTKTTIQNYVRVGVLPPLTEKRFYGKKHIVFLTLISFLREIYSLDEIKAIFALLGDVDDRLTLEIYNTYVSLYQKVQEEFKLTINYIEESTEQSHKNFPTLQSFVFALLISTIGTAAKASVLEICNEQ
ncbi:MAG: DUF1836 domain-containing protein [Defluviitaleaceae bacterium]|nr:DUF1836 domain-containing protein [Defluviitaleaceae bacterium]